MKDNASPELQSIRRQLVSQENDLRKKLDSILRNARSNGWVSDDFSLTLRNGRMVIPLAAEHKRKIKGFIHDESDTGKTVFLEPTEVLEANNEIRELESAERREIIRILMDLTTRLRPHVPVLKRAYTFLGIIDFVRAKACYAIELGAIAPLSVNTQLIYCDKPSTAYFASAGKASVYGICISLVVGIFMVCQTVKEVHESSLNQFKELSKVVYYDSQTQKFYIEESHLVKERKGVFSIR